MKKKKSSMKSKILWEKSLQLVYNVNKVRKKFLDDEMFGLAPLLIQSSGRVASYIGETCEAMQARQQLRLLSVAQSALSECIHYLMIVDEEGYGNTDKVVSEADQISAMIESYMNALRK